MDIKLRHGDRKFPENGTFQLFSASFFFNFERQNKESKKKLKKMKLKTAEMPHSLEIFDYHASPLGP